MPEISRFFGIVIKMFFDDHNPPHFHAFYGGRIPNKFPHRDYFGADRVQIRSTCPFLGFFRFGTN